MQLKIQQIRRDYKLTKSALASKADISISYISEMESGKYDNPSIYIL